MIEELRDRVARHCSQPVTFTHVPHLTLSRADCGSGPVVAVYEPLLCVVVQGRKRVFVGEQVLEYSPATYLLASMHLPAASVVIDGPTLGCVIALDTAVLTQLAMELSVAGPGDDRDDDDQPGRSPSSAMTVHPLGDDLLDPLLRLVRLLDHPQDVAVLAPMIERELLYRLLKGPAGVGLRQLAFPDSRLTRIARAVHAIRHSYATPLNAEQLARVAGMSVTSFHRHFRALTAMSPLQYQKQIRLQEARRLLLTQNADAASAAHAVGYESASQFSREYRRLFGLPPAHDRNQLRSSRRSRLRLPA